MKKVINHPRIKSVTHTYTGKESWEEVIRKIVLIYLKGAKILD